MARSKFGGTHLDVVIAPYRFSQQRTVAELRGGVDVTFWDAETGGNKVTDLMLNGSPASQIPSDAYGYLPQFEGPDGVLTLWADAGRKDGRRFLTLTTDGAIDLSTQLSTRIPTSEKGAIGGVATLGPTGKVVQPVPATNVEGAPWLDAGNMANVLDFGAIPDWDGITGTDNTAAIQAAIDAGLHVYFPAGNYRVDGTLKLLRFQTWTGAGYFGQGSDDQPEGNAKLVFTGTGNACIEAADMASNLIHCAITNMTIRGAGTYSWMMDFPTCVAFKLANVRMETTSLTMGGLRSQKLVEPSFSWVNVFHNVQIKLPDDSLATGTCLDVDWSDAEFIGGGCFGGKYGAILRGTGGIKLIGGRYSQTNTAGIVISVETESLSQHQIVGCQIEEHEADALLIDGDANDALAMTWVMFAVTGCQFRNPEAGAVDIRFKNDTGPVLRGGAIVGNIFTAPASNPISYNAARWTDIAIGVNGIAQGAGAPNMYAGGKFLQPPIVLAQSAVAVPHTGTTAQTTLVTVNIPGGSMRLNGRLRITTLWSFTGAGGTKTVRIALAATSFTARAVPAGQSSARFHTEIANRNSASSQVGGPASSSGWGEASGAVVTGAIDTTTVKALNLTVQLADAADTATLESYMIELVPAQ